MDPINPSRGDEQGARTEVEPVPGPVSADLPIVDGTSTTSEELRDQVEHLRAPESQRVEELRADVVTTVGELAARADVSARVEATTHQAADRLRAVLERTRDRPAALAVPAVLLLLVVVLRRRRATRNRVT